MGPWSASPPLVLFAHPLGLELRAMQQVLADAPASHSLKAVGDVDYYRRRTDAGVVYDVALIRSGRGNTETSGVVSTALTVLRPMLVGMSGIGGTLKDVGVGEVAVATEVVYAEPGRAEATFKARFPTERPGREMRDLLERLDVVHGITTVAGTLAAQEKVLADFSASDYRRVRRHASQAIAVDTESWGLASIAKDHGVEWIITRGISDDVNTKDDDDPQAEAAGLAARVLLTITERWLDRLALRVAADADRMDDAGSVPVLPDGWQPSPDVPQIAEHLARHGVTRVTGSGGMGKSTLARAIRLGREQLTTAYTVGLVEFAVVQDAESAAQTLSDDLAAQLSIFARARTAYELQRTHQELVGLSVWERRLAGPLRELRGAVPHVLLVLDGLERLSAAAHKSVSDWLRRVQAGHAGEHVRLLVFARTFGAETDESLAVVLQGPSAKALDEYSVDRGLDVSARAQMLAQEPATWLDAAQHVSALLRGELLLTPAHTTGRARAFYADRVRASIASLSDRGALLAVLAPVARVIELPATLVDEALRRLTGRTIDAAALVHGVPDLVKVDARADVPHYSLAHDVLAEVIVNELSDALDVDAAREAVIAAHDHVVATNDGFGLAQFVAELEAERMLSAGEGVRAAERVRRALFGSPADNAARLEWWAEHVERSVAGDAAAASAQLRVEGVLARSDLLAPAANRAAIDALLAKVGTMDEHTVLLARSVHAIVSGRLGDNSRATSELRPLIGEMRRALGGDHWDVLTAELELAYTEALVSDDPATSKQLAARARDRFARLAHRAQTLFGTNAEHTLNARHNQAFFTGRSGDPAEAVALYQALLPDASAIRGPRNAETLTIRHEIAFWTGESGEPIAALDAFGALLPVRIEVMGPTHERTLLNRLHIARLGGWLGREEAPLQAADLVRDAVFALGVDHPVTGRAITLLRRLTSTR